MAYLDTTMARWIGVLTVGFGAALLVAPACESGGSGEEETADVATLDDPVRALDIVVGEAFCGCYWEARQFADESACVAERDGFATDSCLASALFDNPAADERLQCLYDAAAAEADCIATSGCGDETEVTADCQMVESEIREACPDYPSEVQVAVDECNEPEPYWAVGDGGMVFGVDVEGDGVAQSLPISADLRAITCDGALRAWAVGDGGVTLHTEDAGAQWTIVNTSAELSLRAIAQAHGTELVAVGDAGAMLLSTDGGRSWSPSAAPSEDLTGVAHAPGGAWLVTSRDGSIFRRGETETLDRVYADPELHFLAVAADHHGMSAAAVGEAGALVLSDDGGQTWSPQPSGTTETLHAVNVLDARNVLAVGEGGTIVRLGEQGVEVSSYGPQALFALHVIADGTGGAAGEGGRLLETRDGGRSWVAKPLPIETDLRGLDQPLVAH